MNKIRKTVDPREINTTRDIYVVINGKAYIPETIEHRISFREYMEFYLSVSTDPRYAVENAILAIKDVIFNPPATIVFWGDGSKTVVKAQNNEEYDPEKGLTMAFFKRMHGNKGHYFEEIKKWTKKYPVDSEGVAVEFTATDWCEMAKKLKTFAKFVDVDEYDILYNSDHFSRLKGLVDRELKTRSESGESND